MKEGEVPQSEIDPREAELAEAKRKIKSYEDLMGKITSYPSGKPHDLSEFFKGKDFVFGFITDTHIGSTKERLADLDTDYKIMEQEGVTKVFNAGDLICGQEVYAGQNNEIKVWGMDNQTDYLVRNYPNPKGIKTYFITGNHDLSFLKICGADVGVAIAQQRKDMIYLDQVEADVKLSRNVVMRLWHGDRGGAYAKSYRMQRYITSLESGQKPNILLSGHYHYDFYMNDRNIHCLQGGAFEHQTLWLKRAGINPSCSAWLVECHLNDGSVNRFKPELLKFF